MDGLEIEEREFSKLSIREQNVIMYKNQVQLMKYVKRSRLHQKINSVVLGFISLVVGILARLHLK